MILRQFLNWIGREVLLEKTYNRLLDTTFTYMCDEYRSAADYLKLAELFDVIVVRNIPADIKDGNSLRRFIIFIDTLYDHKVKLVCSGEASGIQMLFNHNMSQLKKQQHIREEIFALERTVSRLIDMQSEDYIKMLRNWEHILVFVELLFFYSFDWLFVEINKFLFRIWMMNLMCWNLNDMKQVGYRLGNRYMISKYLRTYFEK